MARVPEIIPVTDLRQNAAELLGKVRDSAEPLVITQRGRAAAVLLGIDAYEALERERELLLALTRGLSEMVDGKAVELDDLLAEADRLLSECEV